MIEIGQHHPAASIPVQQVLQSLLREKLGVKSAEGAL